MSNGRTVTVGAGRLAAYFKKVAALNRYFSGRLSEMKKEAGERAKMSEETGPKAKEIVKTMLQRDLIDESEKVAMEQVLTMDPSRTLDVLHKLAQEAVIPTRAMGKAAEDGIVSPDGNRTVPKAEAAWAKHYPEVGAQAAALIAQGKDPYG